MTTIDLDAPTQYVLANIIEVALIDDILIEELHEYAAAARLLHELDVPQSPCGELTSGVRENTNLDGLPGRIYQEALFNCYESRTGEAPPRTHE